jgi:hypothetical protein
MQDTRVCQTVTLRYEMFSYVKMFPSAAWSQTPTIYDLPFVRDAKFEIRTFKITVLFIAFIIILDSKWKNGRSWIERQIQFRKLNFPLISA